MRYYLPNLPVRTLLARSDWAESIVASSVLLPDPRPPSLVSWLQTLSKNCHTLHTYKSFVELLWVHNFFLLPQHFCVESTGEIMNNIWIQKKLSLKKKKNLKKKLWPSVTISSYEFLTLRKAINFSSSSWWCHLNQEKSVADVLAIPLLKKILNFLPKPWNSSSIGHIKPCSIHT